MNKMKKEIREILFPRWDNLHGKKKLLSVLLIVILSALGYPLVVLIREKMSYEIYQLFVLCILVLAVWIFYVAEREMKKKKQPKDT